MGPIFSLVMSITSFFISSIFLSFFNITKATGTSPFTSSGTPITAVSIISECFKITDSKSFVDKR